MPRDMGNGAVKLQGLAKLAQLCVLSLFKCFTLQAFQFYADGVIVALVSAPVLRLACMPSAVIDTDKLTSRFVFEWSPSTEDTFPHVYGTINVDAVVDVVSIA